MNTPYTHELKKRTSSTETKGSLLVFRNVDNLFANHTTYHCASNGCVPCAYKIGSFDVALDKDFCRAVPNERPEQCPRSTHEKGDIGTLGYQREMKVLTIGDGDFSFSLALARIISGVGLTATSYESRETLIQVYPQIETTMNELESLGASLHFNVDATGIQQTLASTKTNSYDRIVWNFPCEAVAKGRDGQNQEMENNKKLISKFFSSARPLLRKGGQIQINHKTKPPFNQWKIEKVATSARKNDNELPIKFYGRVCFDRCLFPPYIPRKALDKKSFPVHDACTFIFGLDDQSNPLSDCVRNFEGAPNSLYLINVNEETILHIRRLLLTRKKDSNRKRRKLT